MVDPHVAAKPIHDVIQNETLWASIFSSRPVRWYGPMLTQMVLLANEEEIEYATATVEEDGAGFDFWVYAFTAHRALIARALGDDHDSGEATAWSIARSQIVSVAVETDASVYGGDAFGSWPGNVVAVAKYPGDLKLRLPAWNRSDSRAHRKAREFLPKLLGDLDRR